MPRQILLPLDLDEVSQAAIPLARSVAMEHDIPITVFSVVEMPADLASFLGGKSSIDALIELEAERRHDLEWVRSRLAPLPVDIRVAHGSIAAEIVLQADRMTDPLIIMASHSRGRLHDLAVSSIRAKVVQAAHCPVLVCRLDQPGNPERIPEHVRRVLVALDGSQFAARALAIAQRVFPDEETCFRLVGATEPPDPTLYPSGGQGSPRSELVDLYKERAHQEAENYLELRADELTDAGVCADWEIITGQTAEAIADAAGDWNADVIALATHGRTGFQRFFLGSVALQVLNNASIPVLMVGPKGWD